MINSWEARNSFQISLDLTFLPLVNHWGGWSTLTGKNFSEIVFKYLFSIWLFCLSSTNEVDDQLWQARNSCQISILDLTFLPLLNHWGGWSTLTGEKYFSNISSRFDFFASRQPLRWMINSDSESRLAFRISFDDNIVMQLSYKIKNIVKISWIINSDRRVQAATLLCYELLSRQQRVDVLDTHWLEILIFMIGEQAEVLLPIQNVSFEQYCLMNNLLHRCTHLRWTELLLICAPRGTNWGWVEWLLKMGEILDWLRMAARLVQYRIQLNFLLNFSFFI